MARRSRNTIKLNLDMRATYKVWLRYLYPYKLKVETFLNTSEKDSILDLLIIGYETHKIN